MTCRRPSILPFRPKPLEDELLSSWLVRVANGNSAKIHTFCNIHWPRKQIWNRDIDQCADFNFVRNLSDLTATEHLRASLTRLSSLEGLLFEVHQPRGKTSGILPLGIYHRSRTRFGLQFCPICLREDTSPYFRKRWRFNHVTCCTSHGAVLLDRCVECQTPIQPFKDEVWNCHCCKFDLRKSPVRSTTDSCIVFEYKCAEYLNLGYAILGTERLEYSFRYFEIVRQLEKVVAFGARSQNLRNTIARKYGGIPFPVGESLDVKARRFEYLSSKDRNQINELLAPLILNWPDSFVEVCLASRNYSSQILKDLNNPPYDLLSLVRAYLGGAPLHHD